MKKFFAVFSVFLLVLIAVLGGGYFFLMKSKSPTAIAARTLKNFNEVNSASVNMDVKTGLKAEVGILQYFGIKDPEAVINMNYDMDIYKDPSLVHTQLDISAFDIDAIKDIDVISTREDDQVVQYYLWNGEWFKYVPKNDEDATEAEGDGTQSVSHEEDGNGNPEAGQFMTNVIGFKTLLEKIADGSIAVEMRKETETRNDTVCYVYDFDMTGDMLKNIITFTSKGKGLIPNLNENERLTGVLYIDAEKYLPEGLTIAASDIVDHKITVDQINTTFSVESMDIDVQVKDYNIGDPVEIPEKYVDINSLADLNAQEWLGMALDFAGFAGGTIV